MPNDGSRALFPGIPQRSSFAPDLGQSVYVGLVRTNGEDADQAQEGCAKSNRGHVPIAISYGWRLAREEALKTVLRLRAEPFGPQNWARGYATRHRHNVQYGLQS